MPFFLLFLIIPVVEIMVLIKVGSFLGLFWTILLILSTAVIGVNILRQQGMAVLTRAGQKLNEGSLPAHELAEGFLLALAGALLITPGLVTDTIGFCLLVPSIRQRMLGTVVKIMKPRVMTGGFGSQGFGQQGFGGQTFEAEEQDPFRRGGKAPFERVEPANRRPDVIDGEFRRED